MKGLDMTLCMASAALPYGGVNTFQIEGIYFTLAHPYANSFPELFLLVQGVDDVILRLNQVFSYLTVI